MGTEALWVPAVMSLVGAGVQQHNTQKTAKKQDSRLARQIADKGVKQREADTRTAQLIQQRAGSTDEAERSRGLAGLMEQMQRNKGNATNSMNAKGAVSDAYQRSAQDAALGATSYGGRIADLMSRIDAPGQQRQREAVDNVRFGQDIDQLKRRDVGDDFLHQMRLRGIQRNPWLDFAGGAMQGAAKSGTDWGNLGSWGGI